MLRLAILSARGRLGTFAGALVALFASAVLVMAGGMMLLSALRAHPPVERYAATAAVVSGQQIVGAEHDVPLGERARVSSALAARVAAVPGGRAAIAGVSAPATLGGRTVDAIGVLAGPGFDAARLHAVAGGAAVLTGNARGRAEYPELQEARTKLIAVTAAFGGLALFIAMFVVAGTMGLSIQQREREIALLRAVAATPGQIRRMIAWEAAIVALVGSAAGIWPGAILGRALEHGLV